MPVCEVLACEGSRGFSKEKLLKLWPSGGDRLGGGGGESRVTVTHPAEAPLPLPHGTPVHQVTASSSALGLTGSVAVTAHDHRAQRGPCWLPWGGRIA